MSHALTLPTTEAWLHRTVSVLDLLFPAPRVFAVRLWNGADLPPARDPAAFTLVLKHPGALRRMFTPPLELALGEAFIYGDFDVGGDLGAAFALLDDVASRAFTPREALTVTRDLLALPATGPTHATGRSAARLSGARHSQNRDRSAVQYHYDVGDDFYALWLDSRLQYSCAYFPTGREDLETAQTDKLDHILRKLRLQPGERLLDIGCGWGGLAIHAARHYGARVLGVTLSRNQARRAEELIAASGLSDRVVVQLLDYRDLGVSTFDKIVSIGMFEHVGRGHLDEYFAHTYRLLKPGGLFLNHGISCRVAARASLQRRLVDRYLLGIGAFSQRHIFPDGELTPISDVDARAERAGFEVRDVENLREHYALTLQHWIERLEARRADAVRSVGELTYRAWRLYLTASRRGFRSGVLNVNQTLLARPTTDGVARIPFSRADLYRT